MASFQKLSVMEIRFIADNIGDKLFQLTDALDLSESDKTEIREQKTTRIQACLDAIEKWKKGKGKNATKQTMINALKLINAIDMVDQLETGSVNPTADGEQAGSSAGDSSQPNDLNRRPTTEETLMVARTLIKEWKAVGRMLGVEDDDLNRIERDEPQVSEMAYAMLKHWLNSKSEPTVLQLCQALDWNSKYNVAEKLGYQKH